MSRLTYCGICPGPKVRPGHQAEASASARVGASHAMLSQNILHAAETDCIPFSQLPLGCSGQELSNEPLHSFIRQPVTHAPHASNATAHGNGVALWFLPRSEERRVGKEWSSPWSP